MGKIKNMTCNQKNIRSRTAMAEYLPKCNRKVNTREAAMSLYSKL